MNWKIHTVPHQQRFSEWMTKCEKKIDRTLIRAPLHMAALTIIIFSTFLVLHTIPLIPPSSSHESTQAAVTQNQHHEELKKEGYKHEKLRQKRYEQVKAHKDKCDEQIKEAEGIINSNPWLYIGYSEWDSTVTLESTNGRKLTLKWSREISSKQQRQWHCLHPGDEVDFVINNKNTADYGETVPPLMEILQPSLRPSSNR